MVTNIGLSVMAWVSALRGTIAEKMHDDERGQDLIEYAVLVGAIGVAAAVALFALQPEVFNGFRDTIQSCLKFEKDNCK